MKTGTAIALVIGVPATIGIIAWVVMANKITDKVITTIPEGALKKPTFVAPKVTSEGVIVDNLYATYLWAQKRAADLGFTGDSDAAEVARALLDDIGAPENGGLLFTQFPPPNDDKIEDVIRAASGLSWKDASAKAWNGINRKLASLRK